MSTFAYRAALVREIEQAMKRIQTCYDSDRDRQWVAYDDGQLDAYAHILSLVSDMEDQ